MEEELLRVLLLIRAELRMAFPNEILEHLGADAGLGALLPQQFLLQPPVRRVGNKKIYSKKSKKPPEKKPTKNVFFYRFFWVF